MQWTSSTKVLASGFSESKNHSVVSSAPYLSFIGVLKFAGWWEKTHFAPLPISVTFILFCKTIFQFLYYVAYRQFFVLRIIIYFSGKILIEYSTE